MGQSMRHFDRASETAGLVGVDMAQLNSTPFPMSGVQGDLPSHPIEESSGQAAQIAWIDAFALSRDCMMKVLSEQQPKLAVRPFASVEEFLTVDSPEVDLIILHAHGPYESCLRDLTALREGTIETPVVILADLEEHCHVDTIREALRAGASGFISTRSMGLGMTLSAIRFVQSGGTFAPLDLLLSEQSQSKAAGVPEDAPFQLTARQRDVLAQLQQGKANKIIAHELGMSESTAKVHIRNIMRKMGATNRTQAAFNALKLYPVVENRHGA